MTKTRMFGAALALVLLAPLAASGGTETTRDGVLWIGNGAEAEQGVRDVALEEMWRVGGEDGEDFFGLVSQVVVGEDGTIYLLDTQLAEVPVYSPDGERVATLSRGGEGPGETRMPVHLLFMPDGGLGLVQRFPGSVVKVGLDGTPQGKVAFGNATEGGFLALRDCVSQGDRLVITGEEIQQNPPTGQIRTSFVAACDAEGQEVVRYVAYPREVDFTQFHWIEDEIQEVDFRKTVTLGDGRVYVAAHRNEYRIDVFAPDGALERVITREFAHRDRSADEISDLETRLETQLAQLPNPKFTVSKTHPDINALRPGPDGNLWVESSRSGTDQPEGIFFTWDVFSPDGHFVEQVAARCPGDGEEDMMLWTRDGAIQVTGFVSAVEALQGAGGGDEEEEEEAPMEVICYRVAGG